MQDSNAPGQQGENERSPDVYAFSYALSTLPDDLQTVVEAWPTLPDAIKAGIVAMVGGAAHCS